MCCRHRRLLVCVAAGMCACALWLRASGAFHSRTGPALACASRQKGYVRGEVEKKGRTGYGSQQPQ